MVFDRTAVLIILDGFGLNPDPRFNAYAQAKAPCLKRLLEGYPHTELDASEHHVGLPPGFMGNSEVGHLNIGAGRVVYQDFSLISKAIGDGSFYNNPAFANLFTALKQARRPGTLHLMGLVSDGGVHSHISHLFALLQMAKREGLEDVAIHIFTDGRDTPPISGVDFVQKVNSFCHDLGVGHIASISGRFYAMDRDSRWERTERAYRALVLGPRDTNEPRAETFSDPTAFVRKCYEQGVTDEFIPPALARGYRGMKDGDGVIFFNFRADRARQITRALTQTDFSDFRREGLPTLAGYVCMTPYDERFGLPTAYEKVKVPMTLGEVVAKKQGTQLRIAETEKYAHVTYFFNGGDEKVFPGEKRVLVASPRDVATYDLKPEMSARGVTDSLMQELENNEYDLVVVNFANCDMVGHTGNLGAAIKAVETVDGCVNRIVDWVEKKKGFALLTADHGNCEMMQDPNGLPLTSHTLLPVPLVIIDPKKKTHKLRPKGKLCDIAPTLLELWGEPIPPEMTGQSLLAD